MYTGEPYFQNVSLLHGVYVVDKIFVCFCQRASTFLFLAMEEVGMRFESLSCLGRVDAKLRQEFDTTFVKCQSVSEVADASILMNKWKVTGNDTDRCYCIPTKQSKLCCRQ